MKRISIFGSTGSIGTQTLDVISKAPREDFNVIAITAHKNYKKLAEQIKTFSPEYAVISDEPHYNELKKQIGKSSTTKLLCGEEEMKFVASLKADKVVAGITGSAGLLTTFLSLQNGTDVLFANKESLVCAGTLLTDTAKKHNAKLIPLDSEHNAIFQIFEEKNREGIDKVILTASGGPFRGYSPEQLKSVTLSQALKHPNWSMGKKITIDSATLFNKGLELIEAHYLFNMHIEKIDAIIHPESIIHSMVQYKDGSTLAQLGNHDMRIPICNALYWPKRYTDTNINKRLDFSRISKLQFEEIDHSAFPSINMCKDAIKTGSSYPIALNASNEIAVENFLQGNIKFTDIFTLTQKILDSHKPYDTHSIEDVINADISLKNQAKELARNLQKFA